MTHLRDMLLDYLEDPSNNYSFVWVMTVFSLLAAYGVGTIFPSHFVLAFLFAGWFILEAWAWYHDDLITYRLDYTQAEPVKRHEVFLTHLRLAVAGALACFLLICLVSYALGRAIPWHAYAICIAAVPLSFVNDWVRLGLLWCLRELCIIPVQIALVVLGLTRASGKREAQHIRLIEGSKRLFALVSGHRSNITFLHGIGDILLLLPKPER